MLGPPPSVASPPLIKNPPIPEALRYEPGPEALEAVASSPMNCGRQRARAAQGILYVGRTTDDAELRFAIRRSSRAAALALCSLVRALNTEHVVDVLGLLKEHRFAVLAILRAPDETEVCS